MCAGKQFSYLAHGGFWNASSDYPQISNISRTSVGNKMVDYSDVVGASSSMTKHMASMKREQTTARRNEEYLSFGI